MRILKKATLRDFWEIHPDSKIPLQVWYRETVQADWTSPHDVTQSFAKTSILSNNRIVFRIKGNKYRLVVKVDYKFSLVFIRFIGNHADYDNIDATTI